MNAKGESVRHLLVTHKLTAVASSLLFMISLYYSIRLLGGAFWSETLRTNVFTIVSYSGVFVFVALILLRRGLGDVEAFSISVSTTLSSMWFFELIYHYSFPIYLNYFRFPFFELADVRTLILDGSMVSLILVGYKYLKIRRNYFFLVSFCLFILCYSFWLLIGFPQVWAGEFYLPKMLDVANPFQLSQISNVLSKLLLCVSWVCLYLKKEPGR